MVASARALFLSPRKFELLQIGDRCIIVLWIMLQMMLSGINGWHWSCNDSFNFYGLGNITCWTCLFMLCARINTETLKVAEIKANGQPHGTFGVEPKTWHDTTFNAWYWRRYVTSEVTASNDFQRLWSLERHHSDQATWSWVKCIMYNVMCV